MALEPAFETQLYRIALRAVELFIRLDDDTRAQNFAGTFDARNDSLLPDDVARAVERKVGIGGGGHRIGTQGNLPRHGLQCCGLQGLGVGPFSGFGVEAETTDMAHIFPFNIYSAVLFDCRHQIFLLAQPPHENAGAAVDKTLSQALMQGI